MRRTSLLRGFPFLVALVSVLCPVALATSDIDQRLRDEYRDKMLVLRGFYSGSSLHFDVSGNPFGKTIPGDWTVDGIVLIDDVKISGDRVRVRASRVHLGWDDGVTRALHDYVGKNPDKDEKRERALQMEADLSPGEVTVEAVDAALSRIFLTSQDSLADLVPSYWKFCLRPGSASESGTAPEVERLAGSCRFSPEFQAVPGLALHSDAPRDSDSDVKPSEGIFHVGRGISAPRVLQHSDPAFSDSARKAKFQGVVTLSLTVDATGTPQNVRIVKPLGCGLDAQAVHTVEAWRFKPAEKDGQPVAASIAVEVDFHLY